MKEILITGGTGTLGQALTEKFCNTEGIKGIRILSRDEYKQKLMKEKFKNLFPDKNISYLLGDVRDFQRIKLALKDVDICIHTAALKDIIKCENDPIEAKKTNIDGSQNIVLSCIENNVKKCILISTDKAVYPVNLYGATKMVAERLFVDGNTYSPNGTKFSVCRYGNVANSRGSVIELFNKQYKLGALKITDRDMTRFWISIEEVVEFIHSCITMMEGKEIFIPKMESFKIIDLAKCFCQSFEEIGIRESEKLHECLVSLEESYHTLIKEDRYIIQPSYHNPIPFSYTSKDVLMSKEKLWEKVKEF